MSRNDKNIDGQLNIFDFLKSIPESKNDRLQYSDGKYQEHFDVTCKIDSSCPCNRKNLTWIAQELGMECKAECCYGCSEKKFCGAACGQSHMRKVEK